MRTAGGESRRRMKRRRSERLSSVNCMKHNAVIEMKASMLLNEGPKGDGWSNGSLDLSAFFMFRSGDNSDHGNNGNHEDGSLSTAPTDADFTTQEKDSSIHLDDVTCGSNGRLNQEAIYLEFDPDASRDLGICTTVPQQPLHSSPPRQRLSNRSTVVASTLTKRDAEAWPMNKSRNPHNDYLAKKYNHDRIERMLNLFCPPDEQDEEEGKDDNNNDWNDIDTKIPMKQSSYRTMNSKILEDFSLRGAYSHGASRTNSGHTSQGDHGNEVLLDMSSLKVLQQQSSRFLLRSRVGMADLPSLIHVVNPSPPPQNAHLHETKEGIGSKPPSRRTPRLRQRHRCDTSRQESKSNLTSASPTGMDDFERWNEHQNDSDKLHLVVAKADTDEAEKNSCSLLEQNMQVTHSQQAVLHKDTLERGGIEQEGDKEVAVLSPGTTDNLNIKEIKARMRRIAAEYGSSSNVIDRRKPSDEGRSIQTEASSILDLKSRLRMMESNFRHFQETQCL